LSEVKKILYDSTRVKFDEFAKEFYQEIKKDCSTYKELEARIEEVRMTYVYQHPEFGRYMFKALETQKKNDWGNIKLT
jgi:uncharacterized protein YeaO (DUF488 family)